MSASPKIASRFPLPNRAVPPLRRIFLRVEIDGSRWRKFHSLSAKTRRPTNSTRSRLIQIRSHFRNSGVSRRTRFIVILAAFPTGWARYDYHTRSCPVIRRRVHPFERLVYGTHASTQGNLGHRADWNRMYIRACLSSVTNQCTYTVGRRIIRASFLEDLFQINPQFFCFLFSFPLYVILIWKLNVRMFYSFVIFYYRVPIFVPREFLFRRYNSLQIKLNIKRAIIFASDCIRFLRVETISCTFRRVFQRNWIFATRSKARITVDVSEHGGCGFIETYTSVTLSRISF